MTENLLDDRARFLAKKFGVADPKIVEDPASEALSSASRQPEERWVSLLNSLRLPAVYRSVPLTVKVPERLAGWRGNPWSLTLMGPTGCGKTWLAIRIFAEAARAAANEWREFDLRKVARFADFSLAVAEIQSEFGKPDDRRTLNDLCRVPLLLLDDLGAERGTPHQQEVADLILRSRYNAQLATILTTNAEDLGAVVSAPVASRLSGAVYKLAGRDRRIPA